MLASFYHHYPSELCYGRDNSVHFPRGMFVPLAEFSSPPPASLPQLSTSALAPKQFLAMLALPPLNLFTLKVTGPVSLLSR